MTLNIGHRLVTSDMTRHHATLWEGAPATTRPDGVWQVTWLPGRLLTWEQARTAMVIAEAVAELQDLPGLDPEHPKWAELDRLARGTFAVTGAQAMVVCSEAEVPAPFRRACRNEHEPDGQPCIGTLTFAPGEAQAQCPVCHGWEGINAPAEPASDGLREPAERFEQQRDDAHAELAREQLAHAEERRDVQATLDAADRDRGHALDEVMALRTRLASALTGVASADVAMDLVERLIAERDRAVAEVEQLRPAPCNMTHTPPYDFAQCETHDETFALGQQCRFNGRHAWEVYAEEADEQRQRAVRAEIERDRGRDSHRDEIAMMAATSERALNAARVDLEQARSEVRDLRAKGELLRAGLETARREGAADGILLARSHVAPDNREILTLLAQHVRDGLDVPTGAGPTGGEGR